MDPILAEMCSIFRPFKHLKKSKKINIIHFLFIFVLWSFFFRNFWPSHILNAYQVIFGISYPSDPIKATSALSNSGNPHVPHPPTKREDHETMGSLTSPMCIFMMLDQMTSWPHLAVGSNHLTCIQPHEKPESNWVHVSLLGTRGSLRCSQTPYWNRLTLMNLCELE